MSRKKSYAEIVADHIATIVETRQITDVLHFTRLDRLPSILEHGIRTRGELLNADLYPSDADRMDDRDDAVSVSISCYHSRMFEAKRYRSGHNAWTILSLHPSLLWNYDCVFFRRGAPTSATKYARERTDGGFGLENLFDECSFSLSEKSAGLRAECGLPPSWPTFPDAEVQVISPIDPSFIQGAWVESQHHDSVRETFDAAGREDCKVIVGEFEPRICRKPYFWG